MKTIERVITTDGGALDLATAILTIAYNLPRNPGAADSLRDKLGLGAAVVHTSETAFSYPNAVALVRDERGRKAVYLFDSDQETVEEGQALPELDPMNADPTAGKSAGAGAQAGFETAIGASPGKSADEIGTGDNGHGPITGDPLDPAAVAAVPAAAPPVGDPPADPEPMPEPVKAHELPGAPQPGDPLPPGHPLPDPSSAETQTIGAGDAGSLSDLGIHDPREGATDLEPLPPAGDGGNVTGTSGVIEPKPDPSAAAEIQGVAVEPRPITEADPLKPEPIAPEPVQLSDAEHEKLAAVALDPAAPETDTAVGQGFAGQEVPADGVTRETTIEAAPGIGAGGTQAGAGDPPADPAKVDPKAAGEAAQADGKARWECPYDGDSDEAAAWYDGYEAAEKAGGTVRG